MSCYMCDDATFDVLAEIANREGWRESCLDYRPELLEQWHDAQIVGDNPEDTIGRVLALANARSVLARYRDASNIGPARTYAFNLRPHRFTPVEILKICKCYDYQACEDDGYNASLAGAIVDAVRHAMIAHLPGYDAAPWGVRDDEAPVAASARKMVAPTAPAAPVSSMLDVAPFRLSLVRS